MIHRQFKWRKLSATVVADSGRPFPLPPLSGAELASLLPLAADFLFADVAQERFGFHFNVICHRSNHTGDRDF